MNEANNNSIVNKYLLNILNINTISVNVIIFKFPINNVLKMCTLIKMILYNGAHNVEIFHKYQKKTNHSVSYVQVSVMAVQQRNALRSHTNSVNGAQSEYSEYRRRSSPKLPQARLCCDGYVCHFWAIIFFFSF